MNKITPSAFKSFLCFSLICLLSSAGFAQRLTKKKVRKMIESSKINADHFTGFALYDMDSKKMIYEHLADKYFIPASNTKLFTFYTSLMMLGDSIPGLKYVNRGDSLIFWGTGDPSFLHSYLKSTKAFDLLKRTSSKLFYADNYSGNTYGRGWPIDNYMDYYQAEINSLPIQDNVTLITADGKGGVKIVPSFMKIYLKQDSSFHPSKFTVERDLHSNIFRYPAGPVPATLKEEIPWQTSPELTSALLQDTLKKPVSLIRMKMPADVKTLYSIPSDTVYRRLLWPSDNMVAEQLLLVCSSTLPGGELSTRAAIAHSKKNFLNTLTDEPQWVDGSGLSRQDLFTPRSMIDLLKLIYDKVGDEKRLFSLLPNGGVSGTLRNAYKTDNGVPFVFAKTGTLTNNHSQSGYLITRKGKKLMYSYMNNNFVRQTSDIRGEMVRIMTEIHNKY